ncbi:MAG TPA: type III-A CRISPR-associated protein Cas10/Csm1, partial [Saprospiraceae bacterium]|nr:type III-A CRISPR-associated protein Cas10/Csm1 [Saprospiraceae bacterium]
MNIKNRQKIVLAALLHDIGKFWERGDKHWKESDVIRKSFPNHEFSHTVPTYENQSPMYGHALWTQAFFDHFGIGKELGLDDDKDVNLATLSARHHKPSNHLEGIISLADKWSSSIDRPDEGEEGVDGYTNVKEKWGQNFNKKIPLSSIFDQIKVAEKKSLTANAFSLKKLNVLDDHTIFPHELKYDKEKFITEDYAKLWSSFAEEITSLENRCKTFDSYFISLCDILRNYTWCIPSATNVEPCNVSLYEHLKTTSGLALCIYDYFEFHDKEINFQSTQDSPIKNEDCLLMVCIDIAGIQNFIYDIANKKAAKSLKGRSFYLQLLLSYIIDQVLSHNDIQAYQTNIIYASGGKAYLLLPNLEKVKDAIEEVDLKIQSYLWKEYKGKLYAVFGSVGFSYETFKTIDNIWTNKIQS